MRLGKLLLVGLLVLVALLVCSPAAMAKHSVAATTKHLSIDQTIRARFGPAHDDTAVCIAAFESTGQHWKPGLAPTFSLTATSATHDHGLFQIHVDPGATGVLLGTGRWRTYFSIGKLNTLYGNVRAALILSNHGKHWTPWSGSYGQGLCHFLS